MHAQDIIDYVENHNKEDGDAYLNSLFDESNFITYSEYGKERKEDFVLKDKVCLKSPETLHFPYNTRFADHMVYIKNKKERSKRDVVSYSDEVEKTIGALKEIYYRNDEKLKFSEYKANFEKYGTDISGVEILLKICDYNNKHPESDIADRLLTAAHKNGVTWCDEIVKDRDNPYFYIDTLCKFYGHKHYDISGKDLKKDLRTITKLYEYARDRIGGDSAVSYELLFPIREKARECLFEAIVEGVTSYNYEGLKEFYDSTIENKKRMLNTGTDGSACDGGWASDDDTNVFETDAYKKAMKLIERSIFRHENSKAFEENDFSGFSKEQKNFVLENTDSKDVAKAIVDSYKGNVEYNDLISKHFSKDEFEQIVEDYKITQYRRENEQLKAEHKIVEQDKENLKREKAEFAQEIEQKLGEIRKNALQNDIRAVCQGEQKKTDDLTPERKKEVFAKMKDEMTQNPNLTENHLTGMCKIYTSKTNTAEQKADYFKELHEVRKSGKTNTEKREKARAFDRVLKRNPELAKDDALKGLAKVDYSAVGIKPTERGFDKNRGERNG